MLRVKLAKLPHHSLKAQLSVCLSFAEEASSAVAQPLKWHSTSLCLQSVLVHASEVKVLVLNGMSSLPLLSQTGFLQGFAALNLH